MSTRDSTPGDDPPDVLRGEGGKWLPGQSPNPGGRKKTLVEIERMLDQEHRNPENLKAVFDKLRELVMGWQEPVFYKGDQCATVTKYDAAFFKLYLERLLGPVKDIEADLGDAPPEVLEYLRKLH